MLIRVPDYFENFHCLAGACPHSCCIGWEVVVDDSTAARYREVSGPLGDKLRAALRQDEEGDLCFPLDGGRCPFLDDENLCEIHRRLGEEATSVTCREHPRFTEDYGPFREITLSASCPKVNDLLLGSEPPLTFREFETPEPGEEGDPWLSDLVPLRDHMIEVLRDRTRPLRQRLRRFLDLAARAQALLDQDETAGLPALEAGEPEVPAHREAAGLFPDALRLLGTLEILEPDWEEVLRQAEDVPGTAAPETALERIAVYFAFRYLLKTVNDGDLLSRAQLCVFAVLVVQRLSAVCGLPEALRRFSREIEHSEDNVEALLDAFRFTFTQEDFLAELAK